MEKCPGCGTRGGPHEIDGIECRDMQYERAWKAREEDRLDHDMDVLA